jgi:hypothetical protein
MKRGLIATVIASVLASSAAIPFPVSSATAQVAGASQALEATAEPTPCGPLLAQAGRCCPRQGICGCRRGVAKCCDGTNATNCVCRSENPGDEGIASEAL